MAAKDSPTKRKAKFDNKKSHGKKKQKTVEPSELSSSAQKRQLKKERQSHRRHADSVAEAKELWNKLRLKSNTPEDTVELMDKTMLLIRGKVKEIALQHDASRVVQAAVQFGSTEQRKELLEEICSSEGGLSELSKIQYAHFCCLKFIKYGAKDATIVKTIVKSFKGNIPKMAVHSVASRVLESLFVNFPPKDTAVLKQEIYGPHFQLYSQTIKGSPSLKKCLEAATTDLQKSSAKNFVKEIISKGMTKAFFGFTYFQDIFAEYVDVADPSEIREMASSVADHSIHMLSTRSGARVIAVCAAYGTPKDRKRICKSLKGYTGSSLLHRDAYVALLRLVQVTDDTVSINKSVLNEILTVPKDDEKDESTKTPLLELALSESGSKLFLMVLVEDDEARMKYFDPYERSILEQFPTITENGKEVPTSKKEPSARRQELLNYLHEGLVEMCSKHADQLLRSVPGSRVLKEVYNTLTPKAVVDAVVKVCEAELNSAVTTEGSTSLFEDPVGHRSVKNLILCDEQRDEPMFSKTFIERFRGKLSAVVTTNRGAFVVAALFKVSSLKQDVKKELSGMGRKLKQLAKESKASAGFEAIEKELK